MASNGNGKAHPCSLSAKRRSNSSPELQVHGMDCKEMEDLPALKLSDSQEDEPGSSSSADNINTDAGPVPRICLEHLRALPRSDGYIGPNMNETDTSVDSSEKQEEKHKTPCNPSLQNVTDDKENDESMVLRSENESSSKPQTKRRPNGLSRVASVLVSKFYSKERPKKPEQQSKEVDIEPSNADCPGLQRGRSKSLSGRILRRFRDASRDSSKDGDESRTSTPKRRQSHRETVKSRAERTQNQAWHGRVKRYTPLINFAEFDPQLYPTECEEDIQRAIREKEIQEGVDPPPGFQPQYSKGCSKKESSASNICTCPPNVQKSQTRSPPAPAAAIVKDSSVAPYPQLSKVVPEEMKEELIKSPASHPPAAATATPCSSSEAMYMTPQVHTQVDYMHCLVPDQQGIMNSCFYWGKIDRYEADEILENKPEGTFLLRDSSQEEFLFSVSFRRYGRTLHARIEQWNHKFSFDAHDPSVYSCDTICGLLEHYKDPNFCMFFEPMLTIPLPRTNPPSLQELARSVICSQTTYDGVHFLELPRVLKDYLKEYHYKQRVRVRHLNNHPETQEETRSPKFVYNVSKTCISR